MTSVQDIIREHVDAEFAYRMAFARATARDDLATLPRDVRQARAALETEAEHRRLADARVAAETVRADLEERWIASHEDMYGLRAASQAR
jgi:hypothetical protein